MIQADVYKAWLDSLKPGDSYVYLLYPRHGDIPSIKKRTVERRTAAHIMFDDGARVRTSDGKIVGADGWIKLKYPATEEELQDAKNKRNTSRLLQDVRDSLDTREITRNLSITQLQQIMQILKP